MCSNRNICGSNSRPNRPRSSGSSSSGAHYALCALGVGLIALGIVMIVWTVMPADKETTSTSPTPSSNSTTGPGSGSTDPKKSSLVAMVLVGAGGAILLLAICLGVRSKRRNQNRRNQLASAQAPLRGQVAQEPEDPVPDPAAYNVPSYDEVVGSGNYPVRQSNLRQSTTQLPSYEDIIAAVENEGREPSTNPAESAPLNEPTPAAAEAQADSASNPRVPARSSSRASRLLRPLRVRRIKSDKLHLKDFRLQIRTPTQNPVTIEPITPPPQYDNKMPELQ